MNAVMNIQLHLHPLPSQKTNKQTNKKRKENASMHRGVPLEIFKYTTSYPFFCKNGRICDGSISIIIADIWQKYQNYQPINIPKLLKMLDPYQRHIPIWTLYKVQLHPPPPPPWDTCNTLTAMSSLVVYLSFGLREGAKWKVFLHRSVQGGGGGGEEVALYKCPYGDICHRT